MRAFYLLVFIFFLPLMASEELAKYIPFSEDKTIGYIKIDDRTSGINQGTWFYVHNAIEEFKKTKPAFVILELNTPGGEVLAAQKISDGLKELDTQYGIPVVAFINNWAISAGAMIAYSARFIAIVKDAAMGAAEPIIANPTGENQPASEKINSAIRADFANRANYFGRNPYIAEKMVDKDLILVKRGDEIILLNSMEDFVKEGSNKDILISPKGKLLTLTADELMEYGVADILLTPTKLEEKSEAEQSSGVFPFKKMLLSKNPYFSKFDNSVVHEYEMDVKSRFFSFLMTPVVSSLLFLGLMLGIYMELSHPGFGLPGTIATVCLILITLSSFALEIGNWLELILVLIGIALILVDLFLLPTFGLLGVIGIIAFLAGLFGMMIPGLENVDYSFDSGQWNAAGEEVLKRLGYLSGTLVLSLVIMALLAKYVMPKFSPLKRLVLDSEQKGYYAGDLIENLPPVGSPGNVISTLRPAGKIEINNRVLDAVSSGDFIERGEKIVIEKIEGSRIFVRRI